MRLYRSFALLALTTSIVMLISGCMPYTAYTRPEDPEAGPREREHAQTVLESLVASATAFYGPEITVEGTMDSVAAAPHAGPDDIDPFYAVYDFTIYLTAEPEFAYSFQEPITSYTPYKDGDEYWDRPHTRLKEFDVEKRFGVGPFGRLSAKRRVPMFHYLVAQESPDIYFDTLDYVWEDGFGHELEWQKLLVQQLADAGYAPEDCAWVSWPVDRMGHKDKEAVRLVLFDIEQGKWVPLKEGTWDSGGTGFTFP